MAPPGNSQPQHLRLPGGSVRTGQCENVTPVTVFHLQISKPIHCEGRSTKPSDLRPATNLLPVPMLAGGGRSGLSDWELVRKVRGRQSQRPHFFKSRTVKQRG